MKSAIIRTGFDTLYFSGAHLLLRPFFAGVGAIVMRAPVDFGVPTHVLLELPIVSYPPNECPQCKAGEPIADPGSRRA